MKRLFLILLTFMSLNAFSQLQVKEGSFKRDGSAVIDDKDEHYDDDYEPMALIKISTVNINEAERMRLAFKGNRATQITKEYLNGQVWLYISKVADFIEISHPDYSLITYRLPETLCGFCVYEMALEYIDPEPKSKSATIVIDSEPSGAEIYIDGKHYGQTPNYINNILIGTHTLKIEKQGCTPITKTITIKENEALIVNEKLQTGKEIVIKTDKSGDKIYVDNNYVGISPVTTSLAFGSHTIKAERNGKTVSKTINVSQSSPVETHGRASQNNGRASQNNEYMLTFVQEINGYEYVDLGLSVKWATCNVGASKPEDYGNYYAWGETTTKNRYLEDNSLTDGVKKSRLQKRGIIDSNGNLTSSYDAATANWGGTWRIPTSAELEELKNKCTWKWTTQNGVKGYKVTGPNGNSIFLPAAGDRDGSSLYYAGEYGFYWSSTPDEGGSDYAYGLGFSSGGQGVNWFNRNYGRSVRPVSE